MLVFHGTLIQNLSGRRLRRMYGIVLNLCRYHWRLTEYRRSLVVTFFLTALVYLVAVAELLARDEPNANQYLSVLLVVASFFTFSCLN